MLELSIFLFEFLLLFSILIFIFIYSTLSTDMLTTLISLLIFLIILAPFYLLLNKFEIFVYINNLENVTFFKFLFFFSKLINVFIGIYLVTELFYLFIIS